MKYAEPPQVGETQRLLERIATLERERDEHKQRANHWSGQAMRCADERDAAIEQRDEAREAYCKLRQDIADTHYLCEDDDRKDKSAVMATIANDLASNPDSPEWRR